MLLTFQGTFPAHSLFCETTILYHIYCSPTPYTTPAVEPSVEILSRGTSLYSFLRSLLTDPLRCKCRLVFFLIEKVRIEDISELIHLNKKKEETTDILSCGWLFLASLKLYQIYFGDVLISFLKGIYLSSNIRCCISSNCLTLIIVLFLLTIFLSSFRFMTKLKIQTLPSYL